MADPKSSLKKPFAPLIYFFIFALSSFAPGVQAGHVEQYNCTEGHPAGFVWSRGVINCIQETCPADSIGRDYGERCKCPEGANPEIVDGLLMTCFGKAKVEASILNITGEVEYSKDGGKTFLPLTKDVVLHVGDFISTSYDSTASLDLGYGQLNVSPLTQLRIDEFASNENIKKTQMFMNVGTVQAIIKKPASIQGDWSIQAQTLTGYSSIRGSEMEVSFDEDTQVTTVLAVEGNTYLKEAEEAEEVTLSEGGKAILSLDGMEIQPKEDNEEIQEQEEEANENQRIDQEDVEETFGQTNGMFVGGIVLVVAVVLAVVYGVVRRKS